MASAILLCILFCIISSTWFYKELSVERRKVADLAALNEKLLSDVQGLEKQRGSEEIPRPSEGNEEGGGVQDHSETGRGDRAVGCGRTSRFEQQQQWFRRSSRWGRGSLEAPPSG